MKFTKDCSTCFFQLEIVYNEPCKSCKASDIMYTNWKDINNSESTASQQPVPQQAGVPAYPIGGYAPGNYMCMCTTCKQQFKGDKRAVQCEPCAIKILHPSPTAPSDAIEFAEWIGKECYKMRNNCRWIGMDSEKIYTTSELYEIFKQRTTTT